MKSLGITSLEGFINLWLGLVSLLTTGIVYWLLRAYEWPPLTIAISLTLVLFFWLIFIRYVGRKVISGFSRAALHVEALRGDEYNLISKPVFSSGKVAEFHHELAELSFSLSESKVHADKQALLIYKLIDQMNAPVLVLDQRDRPCYANDAFSLFIHQPWQMFRNASPSLIGLEKKDGYWQPKQKNRQWQIGQSHFKDNDSSYQLLVFINIESALSATQLGAWRQLIRVISHEINNSLTPVSSLAESLTERIQTQKEKEALALISERCHHLQDFINRYSSLAKQFDLNYNPIPADEFFKQFIDLFTELNIDLKIQLKWIWADRSFMEQVVINLLKNAKEANAQTVYIKAFENKGYVHLKIIDDGHGVANVDNLFVPLYSTKKDGQGIGLTFCRNVITQHQGSLDLSNNDDCGVTVNIRLPLPNNPLLN